MEKLYKQGKVKAIGISNFNIYQLGRILDSCEIKPMVHQIEVHLYFQNQELVKFCKRNQIQVSAFAPLATPRNCPPDYLLEHNETVRKLASKYGKSWAQISLRFLQQNGIIPVVAPENEHQMNEDVSCDTFDLSEIEMHELSRLDKQKRIYIFDYAPG